GTFRTEYPSAMRTARAVPVELLLRAGRGLGGGSAADAAGRPAVHRPPVPRQPADGGLARPTRGAREPEEGPTADAGHGPGGDLSRAPAEPAGPGASHLPLPAAGRQGREEGPGLEHGH